VWGEDPATIPFIRPTGATWEVNQTTLEALSVTLPPAASAPQDAATPTGSAEPTPSSSQ
jgi:hypothetical protein